MDKYILQKSTAKPNSWVLTDTEHGIVVTFEEGLFNDTQKVTVLEDVPQPSPTELARIVGELADWALKHHPDKLY